MEKVEAEKALYQFFIWLVEDRLISLSSLPKRERNAFHKMAYLARQAMAGKPPPKKNWAMLAARAENRHDKLSNFVMQATKDGESMVVKREAPEAYAAKARQHLAEMQEAGFAQAQKLEGPDNLFKRVIRCTVYAQVAEQMLGGKSQVIVPISVFIKACDEQARAIDEAQTRIFAAAPVEAVRP